MLTVFANWQHGGGILHEAYVSVGNIAHMDEVASYLQPYAAYDAERDTEVSGYQPPNNAEYKPNDYCLHYEYVRKVDVVVGDSLMISTRVHDYQELVSVSDVQFVYRPRASTTFKHFTENFLPVSANMAVWMDKKPKNPGPNTKTKHTRNPDPKEDVVFKGQRKMFKHGAI